MEALGDEFQVFSTLLKYPVQRSFPAEYKITDEAADVLLEILQYGSITLQPDTLSLRDGTLSLRDGIFSLISEQENRNSKDMDVQDGSNSRQLAISGIRLCFEEGWVHSVAKDPKVNLIVYVLPSKLHEK